MGATFGISLRAAHHRLGLAMVAAAVAIMPCKPAAALAIQGPGDLPFPGPALLPVDLKSSGTDWMIGNNGLTATFQIREGSLRLARLQSTLNGLDLAWGDPNLFAIYLAGNPRPLSSSGMKLIGQPEVLVQSGNPKASRLSSRLPSHSLRAKFQDPSSGLEVEWTASMTDGANSLHQEIALKIGGAALSVDRIEMLRAELPGAKLAGSNDWCPIKTDHLFLGVEHPMAKNKVESATVVCSLPRQSKLEPGETWRVSSGIGVYPAGQLRRAFLYYLERERAHPYRQYWHYNSWFDLSIGCYQNADPTQRLNEAKCLQVMRDFASELYEKRGVRLDGFVWDDGWDEWNSLWDFHAGFPNGFTKLKEEALKQSSGMGAWLSPLGGYGAAKDMRVKFGKEKGYETNGSGFALGGPKYYAAYRDVCLKMIRDYKLNYFKFDGIGGGPATATDLENLVRLLGDLRNAEPDIFLNCTTGTWASPYWVFFADSIWRGGADMLCSGKGNFREQWINYKDSRVYENFASKSPLFPVNSLMYHGVVLGAVAEPRRMPPPTKDPKSFQHELRMCAAYSSGLGELYITPSLMTPEAWDELAECINWARAKQAVMVDSHWIGGDPRKNEIYGFAAWHPRLGGVITLRNPNDQPQTFAIKLADAFEIPAGATFQLHSPWKADAQKPAVTVAANAPWEITLQPFEVITMETAHTNHRPSRPAIPGAEAP